jgi:2,4-dienoyl-CoA reductase-like NADH-dependent reductase (Old Yellow Enzyme family)/thioredoxin reductase
MTPGILGSPVRLGGVELRNRVVAAPMERNYCDANGLPTDHYVDHLGRLGDGGASLVYTEATYVRADGRVRPLQMAIDDDRAIPGLRRMAAAVHRTGALLGVQLVHGGRLARAAVTGMRPVAPSPVVAEVIDGDLPTELDIDDITHLVASFGAAAERCVRAGVDVISIHAAHGYLISQFLSPRTNLRRDHYGAPHRFLGEVIDAVRSAAPELSLGVRVSAYEGVDDGLDTDRTLAILRAAGVARLDFVDVSAGCYEAGQWITPSGEFETGLHARHARRFRDLGVPIGVAGRITDAESAERIVSAGQADFVTVARALHADPGWTNKILTGRAPRPCIACNYCTDSLRDPAPVPCAVNPEAAASLPRAPGRKHAGHDVLVVGGGPAGLEAARRFGLSGCRVRLVEREPALGGLLRLAARLHEYPEYHRIIDWYEAELANLGVAVETGRQLSPADIADAPERTVVVASGVAGYLPDVRGRDHSRVVELTEWLRRHAQGEVDSHYVIWGADRNGAAVADHLAVAGAQVTLIGAQAEPAEDVGARAKLMPLARLTSNPRVRLVMNASVEAIGDREIEVRDHGGTQVIAGAGRVLVSQGGDGATSLAPAVKASAPDKTVMAVGDAGGHGGWAGVAIRNAAESVTAFLATEQKGEQP